MRVGEVERIGKLLKDYVSYRGFNLWEIAEAGIYNNFLSNPRKRKPADKMKDVASRALVKWKQAGRGRKPISPSRTPAYLFVAYDVSHVKTFLPIIKRIKNFRVIRHDSPATEIAKDTLEANGVPYDNLDSYADKGVDKAVDDAEKILSRNWKKLKQDITIKEKLGNDYPRVMDALEYHFATRKRFLEIVRMIELFEKVFAEERVLKVVVSDDVNPVGRIACLVAKRRGIPSIVIQHGQLQGNPVGKITADRMAVNGYADKEFLVSKGADPKRIVVAGQPRFDRIKDMLNLDRKDACKELGLDAGKKTIVFTAQKPTPGESVTRSALRCFLNEIKKIKDDYNFIITVREDWSPKELDDVPGYVKTIGGGDIQKILRCADVLVTAFSTVAIEAVLLDRPVITINIGDRSYIDYGKEGVGVRILREEDFLKALDRVLNDRRFISGFKRARKGFIRKYSYRLDGKSTERIINLIKVRYKTTKT